MTARLGKRNVERLLATYDGDPSAALADALRIVLGMPEASWTQLLAAAPFDDTRRHALERLDQRALDALARELNELRTLDGLD